MENDQYLTKFHGILLSLSKKGILHTLPDDLTEAERKKYQIEELSNFIAGLPSFTRCKIAYYMILNAELRLLDELKNDEFIGLLVNLDPPIPLLTLIKWIEVLDLFSEYCKVIENSPPDLGEELLSLVFKRPSFLQSNNFYFTLWCSVFKKICKIEKKNCSESPQMYIHYFEIINLEIEKSLCSIRTPSQLNLNLLHRLLKTALCLINYYKNPEEDEDMYKLSIKLKVARCDEVQSEKGIDFLFRIMNNVLGVLDCEKWKLFLNHYDESKTSNLISALSNEMKLLNGPTDALNVLSKLSVNASLRVINSLIADAEQGKGCSCAWGIVSADVTVCQECPLHELAPEDLEELLQEAFTCLYAAGEEMKALFLAAVSLSHNQYTWLKAVFDKYQPNLLTTSNAAKDLVETFNKISNMESIPLNSIIPLCMESPHETIKKLCQLAVSAKAADVSVFRALQPACHVLLPTGVTLLDDVLLWLLSEELTSAEEDSLRRFVLQLRKQGLVGVAFLECLMKRLKEFLDKEEMHKAVLCLAVTASILVETEGVNKAAFLVFMSQVLGRFSWDLRSFSTVKANGRDALCSIVAQLMADVDPNWDDEAVERIRQEILKGWEVNQACFCDLWFKFGKAWQGSGGFDSYILALLHSSCRRRELRHFLLTFGPPNEVRTSVVLALIKLLPVLGLDLWERASTELTKVWTELNPSGGGPDQEVLDMFISAWYLLTLHLNEDDAIHPCYKHCLAGFGRLLASAHLDGEALVRAYAKILFIMRAIRDKEVRKSCLMVVLPALKGRLASASTKEAKAHAEQMEDILSEEFKD